MQQISNRGEATRWLVITVDLIVVNTLYRDSRKLVQTNLTI